MLESNPEIKNLSTEIGRTQGYRGLRRGTHTCGCGGHVSVTSRYEEVCKGHIGHMAVSTLFATTASTETLNGTIGCDLLLGAEVTVSSKTVPFNTTNFIMKCHINKLETTHIGHMKVCKGMQWHLRVCEGMETRCFLSLGSNGLLGILPRVKDDEGASKGVYEI